MIQPKIDTLNPREREVPTHVVAGRLNRQIAGDLGTAEKTIKVHRSRMMELAYALLVEKDAILR